MSGCAFPPWTGVVEARDEDGIVSHPEEQLNPNRSSIPRKTSRGVAQLMMYPCTRAPLQMRCCGAWKDHFTPVAGISRFHARKARPGARKVVSRSLSTICSASFPSIHANPLQLQTSPSGILTTFLARHLTSRLHHGSRVCTYPSRLSPGGRGGHQPPNPEAARDLHP